MMSGVCRSAVAGAVVGFGVVAGVSGQVRPAPAQPATAVEELVVEVRALRAELNQAAAASMRAQLLAMRLQLQEQRISVAARQLGDVQERLRSNELAAAQLGGQLKMFEQDKDADQQELDHVLGPLKAQLALLEKRAEQLKTDEIALSQLLTEEQSRWSSFNSRIEELEKAAAGKAIR